MPQYYHRPASYHSSHQNSRRGTNNPYSSGSKSHDPHRSKLEKLMFQQSAVRPRRPTGGPPWPSLRDAANTTYKVTLVLLALSSCLPPTGARYVRHMTDTNEAKPNDRQEGIAPIASISSQGCSASFFQLEKREPLPSDPVMALSSGHCYAFLDPGVAYSDKPIENYVYMIDEKTGAIIAELLSVKVAYATMERTDIQVIKTSISNQKLKEQFRTSPYILSSKGPKAGDSIEIVSSQHAKRLTSEVSDIVPQVQESRWSFHNAIGITKNSSEMLSGGFSGSPIIATNGKIVGSYNTKNEDGESCTLNNPCEIHNDTQSSVVIKGKGYGVQTAGLNKCLNDKYDFHPSNECDLVQPDAPNQSDQEQIQKIEAFITAHPSATFALYYSEEDAIFFANTTREADSDESVGLDYCNDDETMIKVGQGGTNFCTPTQNLHENQP